MKITAAICDDETYYLNKIRSLVEKNLKEAGCQETEIVCFASGEELCRAEGFLKRCQVIFLDINMQECDGIEVAYRIKQKYSGVHVVFVTAYIDYAVMGYRVEAFRYLLKNDLEAMMRECTSALMKKLQQEEFCIMCNFSDGEQLVKVGDILYIESFHHRMVFHMNDDTGHVRELNGRMTDLEKQLSGYGFYRVHKSYLVNMHCVEGIERYQLKLVGDEYIQIPREKYQNVRDAYFDVMRDI